MEGGRDARLRDVWNATVTACFICDVIRGAGGRIGDFRICDVNASGLRLTGRSRDELIGARLSECFPGLWPGGQFGLETQVAETGESRAEECRLELSGQGERRFEKHLVKSGDGIAVFLRDVTDRTQTAELLARSRHELIAAQRMGRIGSWLWEISRDRVTWSEELYRIAGRDPDRPAPNYAEHPGLYTPGSWERLQQVVRTCLETGRPFEIELELIRPGGETCWTIGRGEAERDAAGRIVLLRGTLQDVTERKLAELKLKALSRRILEAQEAERRRVARELHDGVGQLLVSTAFRLHAFETALPAEWRSGAAAARGLISDALGEVRRISHGLRPSALDDLGLAPALRALVSDFRIRTGIGLMLHVPRRWPRLPATLEQTVYRIAQEALTNIERHAAAREVHVRLVRTDGAVRLSVCDDGRGLAPTRRRRTPASGLGLRHMRERAELAGGTFELTPARGGGTMISVELPVA
jgi:signal transduction histidine kinase